VGFICLLGNRFASFIGSMDDCLWTAYFSVLSVNIKQECFILGMYKYINII